MKMRTTRILSLLLMLAMLLGAMTMSVCAAEMSEEDAFAYLDSYADNVGVDPEFDSTIDSAIAVAQESVSSYATLLSLLPPVIAIALALLTKEVYSSLFIGIVVGGLFYANFDPRLAYLTIFTNSTDGGMLSKLSDSWNVGILIFLVVLGIIVALMNKAGGSAAYGKWAANTFKTRRSAMLGTSLLGCLIFVDDYFNCLTVGSVMRPVTDTHKVSRAKLAYLIDATAAPICIIAPISSWAAAVAGVV